jgi:hypothetical protein
MANGNGGTVLGRMIEQNRTQRPQLDTAAGTPTLRGTGVQGGTYMSDVSTGARAPSLPSGWTTDSRLTPRGGGGDSRLTPSANFASGGGVGRSVMNQNQVRAPYNSSVMTASHAFTPLGMTPEWMKRMPGYVPNTVPVMGSYGGDVHMPAGTGNVTSAMNINQWFRNRNGQGTMQQGGAPAMQQGGGPDYSGINWERPVFRNLQTGALSNNSANVVGGRYRGGLPQLSGAALGQLRMQHDPEFAARIRGQQAAPAPTPPTPPTAPPPQNLGQVGTTIEDPPIYDPAFIRRLTNRAAEDARLDPREAMSQFDRPGMSRDEGQMAQAIPGLAQSRAQSNRLRAEIPFQAELANRGFQLAGQMARGQEGIGLANILRQFQGAGDMEQASYMQAFLDPLLQLLRGF